MLNEEDVVSREYMLYKGPYHGSGLTIDLNENGFFVICRFHLKNGGVEDVQMNRHPDTQEGEMEANEEAQRMNTAWRGHSGLYG